MKEKKKKTKTKKKQRRDASYNESMRAKCFSLHLKSSFVQLTPTWVGFLGVRFEVESGGKTTPLSKTCQNYAKNLKFGT